MNFSEKRTFGPTPNYPLVKEYKRPHDMFTLIAGPCSVESPEQIFRIAEEVKNANGSHLRGGVFRAGTYPGKDFGYKIDLLKALSGAAKSYGLKSVVEVLDYSESTLDKVCKHADCLQVGSRGMQNYTLLKTVGKIGKPVFLKRNQGATLDEWLGAAEWVLSDGKVKELYLVERGSSSFVNHVRWDLSISMIPAVKAITDIPVIVDASHGTGRRDLVRPMTWAGIAAGADGCLIETHYNPDWSLSDAEQALGFEEFKKTTSKINLLREVVA